MRHRGPDPRDAFEFSTRAVDGLRAAGPDLCWLLSRGYTLSASLKLVGDRFRLTARQRGALARCVCSDHDLDRRRAAEIPPTALAGRHVAIDGFNTITTLESALGGAVVLVGRDGCCRDIAGVHGSFRRVEETLPAIRLLGEYLSLHGAGPCVWYFDRPVSNSGRIASAVRDQAARCGWDFSAHVVPDPDVVLSATSACVVTSDAAVLDRAVVWTNVVYETIVSAIPTAWLVRVF